MLGLARLMNLRTLPLYVIRGVQLPGLIDKVSKKCRKEEGKVPAAEAQTAQCGVLERFNNSLG